MGRPLNLGAYMKSEDGTERILQQVPFVARGQIWQGFKGALFLVRENQVTDQELTAYDDLDGTKAEVWQRRDDRLKSRSQFKAREYDKRRAELRAVKNEIRQAIKADKELGIPPSPSDLEDIARIEERMQRLVVLSTIEERVEAVEVFEASSETVATVAERPRPTFDPKQYACPDCGEVPPLTSKNPIRWQTGHRMGKHSVKRTA